MRSRRLSCPIRSRQRRFLRSLARNHQLNIDALLQNLVRGTDQRIECFFWLEPADGSDDQPIRVDPEPSFRLASIHAALVLICVNRIIDDLGNLGPNLVCQTDVQQVLRDTDYAIVVAKDGAF